MPTNQSSPWGGGKLRACSSADGTPTAASVFAQNRTGAAPEVPFSKTSSELSWSEDQATHRFSTAASTVASPVGSSQEKGDGNKTSPWNHFSAVPEGSLTLPQKQKWIYCSDQILAPSELKRMESSSSFPRNKEEPELMEAMRKCAALQTKLSGNSSVRSGQEKLGLEPPSVVNHQDLLIRGHSPSKQSRQITVSCNAFKNNPQSDTFFHPAERL